MSSARVLTFDPKEDVIVLEEAIEVDEQIERPESVRFFTIEEQEVDAYETLMPKGRTTQFQRDEVRDLVTRMRELHDAYVLELTDDYALREPVRGTHLSWVHPVYANVELQAYDFANSWTPLFENRRAPGYYPRLANALPRPYVSTGGVQSSVSEPTEFVNSAGTKPLRVLPTFMTTKMVVHEDRTVEIVPRPMKGSEDVVTQLGYFLDARPMPVPNPLPDHPFLKSNEATFVESTAPLIDVLPSLDAVLTHGVPVTSDPYGVAGPYLKLYDVNLADIPWSSWKSRFPPVEVEQILRDKQEIPFPTPEEISPSETILKAYKTTYAPGIAVREWLMRQDDGGEFVAKALLSKAMENGSVELIPGVDLPVPEPPATTLDECSLLGLTFPDFLVKGLLRQASSGKLLCVPLEHVRQERARVGFLNRKAWGDGTEAEIIRRHIEALRRYRRQEPEIPVLAEQKTPGKPESVHRREVIAILQDPRRHTRDKLRDIKEIVKDDVLSQNLYMDADEQFVLCGHTLAVLSGDLEKDRAFFYDVWTAKVDGWRVCKHCGERLLADDFVDQEEYDEQGFILNKKETLETGPVFHDATLAAFTTGLKAIAGLFDTTDPAESLMLHICSLLQVLPNAETVTFYVSQGRAFKAKKAQAVTEAGMEARGIVGLALTMLLLQTHIPILEPRRSFWSKPVSFNGYPRDAETPEEFGVIDILLMVLENTYRGFPTALSGPLKPILRAVLTKPKDIRKFALTLMKTLLQNNDIQASLDRARAYVKTLPPPPAIVPFLPVRPPLATTKGYPKCPSGQSILGGKNPPRIRQPEIRLRRFHAAEVREPVVASTSERVDPVPTPKEEIRRRKDLAGSVTPLAGYRTNLLVAQRLGQLRLNALPIASVDPTQSADALRDIAKGFVNEASHKVKVDLDKDISLFCLVSNYDKAKAEARKVRATERLEYTQRMANMTDLEREIDMDLANRGMAPIILTLAERSEFGRRVGLEQLIETGVGLPRDYEDDGDRPGANAGADLEADNGDYGDNAWRQAGTDSMNQPTTWDDNERST